MAAAPPGDLDALLADVDRRAQQRKGATPTASANPLDALLADVDRRAAARHRPAAAPTAAAPVLPPVGVATPGVPQLTPPASIGQTPAAAPQAPPQPGYMDVNWQNKAANPALKNIPPTAADAAGLYAATLGQDMAAMRQVREPPILGHRIQYQHSPQEEALSATDKKLDTLPAYLKKSPAEGGPVQDLRTQQNIATVKLGQALPGMIAGWRKNDAEINRRWKEMQEYHDANTDIMSKQQAAVYNRNLRQLQEDTKAHQDRAKRIDQLTARVAPVLKKFSSEPVHSGIAYPEEVRGNVPSTWDLFGQNMLHTTPGKVATFASGFIPFFGLLHGPDQQKYQQAVAAQQISGAMPPPVPFPKGTRPAQRQPLIDQKNQLAEEYRKFVLSPREFKQQRAFLGKDPYPTDDAGFARYVERRVGHPLTAWQRQIAGNLRQQVSAERDAYNSVRDPQVFQELLTGSLALLGAHVGGGLGAGLAEQSLAGWAAKGGARAVAARFIPGLVGEVTGGATGGGLGRGAAALTQGATPAQALLEAGKGAVEGAKVGAFAHGVRVATGLAVRVPDAFKSGWDAEKSPRLVNMQAEQMRQQHTLSPEETGALRDRLTELAKAPTIKKTTLWRNLQSDLARGRPGGATPAERAAEARVVKRAELPAHEPAGPRIATPTGEAPLRMQTPDQIQEIAAAAAEAGDTATAQRAQQWLDQHEQHQARLDQPIPMDELSDYLKERHKPGNVAMAQSRTISTHAEKIAQSDPELAATLRSAAQDVEKEFKNDYLTSGGKTADVGITVPAAVAPPEVSAWRKLTLDQRDALPENVRQALLTQDVHNSLQALTPGADPVWRMSQVPEKPRSTKDLIRVADSLYDQAERHLDALHPAPVAEPVAQPTAEAAAAPQETGVQPPEAAAAPLVPETPPAPVAAPAAATEGAVEATPGALPSEPALIPSESAPLPSEPEVSPTAPEARPTPEAPPHMVSGDYTGPERRIDLAERRRIAEMSPEEMRHALSVDPMTGLGGRMAWEEFYGHTDQNEVFHPGDWFKNKNEHLIATDVDSLKFVNKRFGHERGGDVLLRAVGDALKKVGLGDDFFHVSGDEYNGKTVKPKDAEARLAKADEWLRNHWFTFKDADGSLVEAKGFGLSYAIGEKGEEFHSIDDRLSAIKEERAAAGIRGEREQRPPHYAERPGGAGEAPREAGPENPPAAAGTVGRANKEVRSVVPNEEGQKNIKKSVAKGQRPSIYAETTEAPGAPAQEAGAGSGRPATGEAGGTEEAVRTEVAPAKPKPAKPKPAKNVAAKPPAPEPAPATRPAKIADMKGGTRLRLKDNGAVVEVVGTRQDRSPEGKPEHWVGIKVIDPGSAGKDMPVGARDSVLRGKLLRGAEVIETPTEKPAAAPAPSPVESPSGRFKSIAGEGVAPELIQPGSTFRRPIFGTVVEVTSRSVDRVNYRVVDAGKSETLAVGDTRSEKLERFGQQFEVVETPESGRKGGEVAESGFKGGSKAPQPQKPSPLPNEGSAFESPELAEWARKGRKQEKVPLGEQIKQAAVTLKNMAVRTHRHLPGGPEFAETSRYLTKLENMKEIAGMTSALDVAASIDRLTPDQLHLFEDTLIARDLQENQALGVKNPAVWTPEKVASENAQLDRRLEADPAVTEALGKWKAVKDDIGEQRQEAAKALHGRNLPLTREDHFHRDILEYANAQAGGSVRGHPVQSHTRGGYLAGRTGSEKAFSTDFIRSQGKHLADMIADTEVDRFLKFVHDRHDIGPHLQSVAAFEAEPDLAPFLKQVGSTREFAKKAVAGAHPMLDRMGELAANGTLPDTLDGQYAPLLEELGGNWQLNQERAAQGSTDRLPLAESAIEALPGYGKFLETQRQGKTVKGGMVARVKGGQLPKGYEWYQPEEGTFFYKTWAMPDAMAARIAEGGPEALGLEGLQAKQIIAMGRRRKAMALPSPLVRTLEEFGGFRKDPVDRFLSAPGQWARSWWNQVTLLSPARVIKYNVNNMFGDTDPVYIAAPEVLGSAKQFPSKWVRESIGELRDLLYKDKGASQDVRDWIEQGGMAGTLQSAERMGDLKALDLLAKFADEHPNAARKVWSGYWKGVRLGSDFREAILRLAAYKYANEKQTAGEPLPSGATRPDELLSIEDRKRRSYVFSDDILGAYDRTTALGRQIAKAVPFWRFKDVNWRRWYQLGMNHGFNNPRYQAAVGRRLAFKVGGAAVAAGLGPTVAAGLGTLAMKLMVAGGMGVLWNQVAAKRLGIKDNPFTGDSELPQWVRGRPHLLLPFRNPLTGKVMVYTQPGSSPQAVNWLGFDNVFGWGDIVAREGWPGVAKEMARSLVQETLGSIGPWTGLIDAYYGRARFPDPLEPRAIRDKVEYLADQVQLGGLYRYMRSRPQRPGTFMDFGLATALGANEVDIPDSNYQEMYGVARDFLQREGKGGTPAGGYSPKTNALYQFKKALRYGDTKGAERFLLEYGMRGGTDKDLEGSLKSLEPLGGFNRDLQAKFLKGLNAADEARLRRSYQHWQNFTAPHAPTINLSKLPIAQFVDQMRSVVGSGIKAEHRLQSLSVKDRALMLQLQKTASEKSANKRR